MGGWEVALRAPLSELAGWPLQRWQLPPFWGASGEYAGVLSFVSEDSWTLGESVPASGGLCPIQTLGPPEFGGPLSGNSSLFPSLSPCLAYG